MRNQIELNGTFKIEHLDKAKYANTIKQWLITDKWMRKALCMASFLEDDDLKQDYWNFLLGVVCERQGQEDILIGFINANYNSAASELYIKKLYVMPDYRSYGFGKLLVEKCCDLGAELFNVYRFSVATVEENLPLEKFYKRLKFKYAGRHKQKYYYNGTWLTEKFWIKNNDRFYSKSI